MLKKLGSVHKTLEKKAQEKAVGGVKVNMIGLTSVMGRKKKDAESKKAQSKTRWGKSLKPK